ncbi:STAS domain-containing protein [Nonomuraea sp. NPDC003727]
MQPRRRKPPLDAVRDTEESVHHPVPAGAAALGKRRRSGHACADLAGQPNPAAMPSPHRQTFRSRKQSAILKLRIGASRLRRTQQSRRECRNMTSQLQGRTPFTVSTRRSRKVALVRVAGELDLATAPTLRAHLRAATAPSASSVLILDLSGVTFCDSVGLSELVVALQHSQNRGKRLVLSGVPASLDDLLYRTGLHKILERRATCDEALRHVRETRHAHCAGHDGRRPA